MGKTTARREPMDVMRRRSLPLLGGVLALMALQVDAAEPVPTQKFKIVELDARGVPAQASVGGNRWCRGFTTPDLGTYQAYVAELLAAGGEVQGASMARTEHTQEWFVLVCGRLREAVP